MMFHKDLLLSEENEETKLLEAEEADPGQKASSAQDRCLPAFALTSLGLLLVLLCVAYFNTAKGKNLADSFSSSKEQNTVIVNDQSDTFVYAMTYDPGFCYKKRESEWPGCFNSNKEWTKKLTIHGLWPEVRITEKRYQIKYLRSSVLLIHLSFLSSPFCIQRQLNRALYFI